MNRQRSTGATAIIAAASVCMVLVGLASIGTSVFRGRSEFLVDTAMGGIIAGLGFLCLGTVGIVHATTGRHRPIVRLLAIASGTVAFVACFPIAAIGVVGLY